MDCRPRQVRPTEPLERTGQRRDHAADGGGGGGKCCGCWRRRRDGHWAISRHARDRPNKKDSLCACAEHHPFALLARVLFARSQRAPRPQLNYHGYSSRRAETRITVSPLHPKTCASDASPACSRCNVAAPNAEENSCRPLFASQQAAWLLVATRPFFRLCVPPRQDKPSALQGPAT